MITLTIIERTNKNGKWSEKRSLKMLHSMDKAKKFIQPIAKEMEVARETKSVPASEIVAVSYDEPAEKDLLLSLKAIITTENE